MRLCGDRIVPAQLWLRMVRVGMSLPALQRLMGHSQIQTTLLYVQLGLQDVWREYVRAIGEVQALGFFSNLMNPPQPSLGPSFQIVKAFAW